MEINTKEKEHQALIEKLAQLPETQLNQEIHNTAGKLVGTEDEKRLAQRESELHAEVEAYNHMHVDAIAADYAQQRVKTSSTFGKDGYAGQSTQVQAEMDSVNGTKLYGHATVNQDKQGNPSAVNVGVNFVGEPHRFGDTHILPVGRLEAMVATNGDEFTAKNVTGVAGAIFSQHDSKVNVTAAVVTDAKLTDPTAYVRLSGTAYDGKVEVTPYAEATAGMKSGNLGAGAGVRMDKDLGGGYDVYGQGSVNASGLSDGKPNLSGQVTLGVMWGGAEKKTELEKGIDAVKPQEHQVTDQKVEPHYFSSKSDVAETKSATSMLNAAEKNIDSLINNGKVTQGLNEALKFYNELANEPKSQQHFMEHIASNFAKNNPLYTNREEAQSYLQNIFDNANYLNQQQRSAG